MTGWIWPFDAVQKWFEGLWNWISNAAVNAVSVVSSWVWGAIYWVRDRLSDVLWWLKDQVWGMVGWVVDSVRWTLDWLWNAVSGAFSTVSSWITNGLNWLWNTVSEGLGSLWTAISTGLSNIGSTVWNAIGGLWDSLTGLASDIMSVFWAGLETAFRAVWEWLRGPLNDFVSWLVGGITWLGQQLASVFAGLGNMILAPVTAALQPGSPDKFTEQVAQDFSRSLFDKVVLEAKKVHASPAQPELAIAAGVGVLGGITLMHSVGQVLTMSFDATHPVKKWGAQEMFNRVVLNLMGSPVTSGILAVPVLVGIVKPMTYAFNNMFTPEVPGAADLTRFANERLIGMSAYYENMRYQGYTEVWSDAFLQASWRVPGFSEMQQMVWRGKITIETLEGGLRAIGTREDFIPGYTALVDQVPSYADMIRIYVREGYLPEYQAEIPEGMLTSFRLLGYSEDWAKMLWGAHWVLPSTGQVFEMLHRGIIDSTVMSTYLKTADILGVWRDRLIAISWDLPGRIDARWMAGWDEISPDEYGDLLVKRGLDPAWRERVATATIKQQMAAEINKLRDNIKTDLIKGYILEPDARAALKTMGFSDAKIEYHVQDALQDRERSRRDALVDNYLDAYAKELIETESELAGYLSTLIVDEELVQLMVEDAYIKRYKKPKAG